MGESVELTPARRLMRSAILLICLATLLLTVLQVLGNEYFPGDDALRRAGGSKAC